MGLFINPMEFYAKEYSKATGTAVTADDIELQSITAVPNYYPPENRVKNTMAKVVHGKVPVNIFYDRVSFSRYAWPASMPSITLPSDCAGKVRNLIPKIREVFGIEFLPEEIEDDTFTISPTLNQIVVRLTAVCRYFTQESFTLKVAGSYEVVDGQVIHVMLEESADPDAWREGSIAWYGAAAKLPHSTIMTARIDYTPIADILREFYPRSVFTDDWRLIRNRSGTNGLLLAAMKSVDGLPWTSENASRMNNLYMAYITYNGPTKHAKTHGLHWSGTLPMEQQAIMDLVNLDFDNVMIITLRTFSPGQGPALKQTAQQVVLHYNNSVRKGRVNENPA